MSRAGFPDQDAGGAGGVLAIDLAALKRNYHDLAKRAEGAATAAVVKADAYGLGIEPVGRALDDAGCAVFFVATADEAQRLRKVLPDAVIYVLNGLSPGTGPQLLEAQARPVLGSIAEIREWITLGKAQGAAAPAAIHIDTGMNRLGLAMDELTQLKATPDLLDELNVSLVMTHLACADRPDHDMNATQLARFRAASRLLPRAPLSAANSAGLLNGPDNHLDLVRPGIALYGGNPRPTLDNPMSPVVQLLVRILQTREISKGDSVGYGATFTARAPMRIGILALGYADGFFRKFGEQANAPAEVFVAGRRVPVIGRISMDLAAIDITGLSAPDAARGTMAEVLGPNITVDELATHAGTIGYEVLTSLSARMRRVYLGEQAR